MKISFVTTVFNEEKTITKLLDSLYSQTMLPNEIIIVDGGSTDSTLSVISNFQFPISKTKIKIITKKGNRSVGRNEAIKRATGDIIVCSDSGNILDKNWIKNITRAFIDSRLRGNDKRVDVVAGYYKGKATTVFQKCLIPYVLVMPDNVDPENFLPATRSIAFTKSIWKKAGRFDEKLSHNEDYAFAQKLKKIGAKIVFAKDAIAYWLPRKNFTQAFIMFFRFALGDTEAGIFRSNVLLIFVRYIFALYLMFLGVLEKSFFPIIILFVCFVMYTLWAIKKNYTYVKEKEALWILPVLQYTADLSVILGTSIGFLRLISRINILTVIRKHIFLCFVIVIYILLMLSVLSFGIPNQNHPFPYNMDEWHQLNAVRATFKYGSPNRFGAANGTMFHFLLSGFYLIPFVLTHVINPIVLHVNDWIMRERIFVILRVNTILWGSLSIVVLYKILDFLKANKKIALFLFTFSPIWLSLSNYFKYDIALIFWIFLSLYAFLRFSKNPTNTNYILVAIPPALAFSVKVSAIPLLPIYLASYFWFVSSWKKNIKYFFVGLATFFVCAILFGIPDALFGKGNILLYLKENVLQGPASTSNYQLGMNPYVYLFTLHYPMIFGHMLMLFFGGAVLYWLYTFIKAGRKVFQKFKTELFLFFACLVFIFSLLPLQITAGANRSVVLLPFFVLIIAIALKYFATSPNRKIGISIILFIMLVSQSIESWQVVYMKLVKTPRETSSVWIQKNISKGTQIGIENIPIYLPIPDIIQKEFYFFQYNVKQNNLYTYDVIDEKSVKLPQTIVINDDKLESDFFKVSSKKSLLKRMRKEGYIKIATFSPDLKYYKLFNKEKDYYFYGVLVAVSSGVSVYKK